MSTVTVSTRRVSVLGVAAQFLALIRILSEVFRLKFYDPDRYTLRGVEPFVGAALFTTVLIAIAVAAFALGRVRMALAVAIVNVVALLAYKVAFM